MSLILPAVCFIISFLQLREVKSYTIFKRNINIVPFSDLNIPVTSTAQFELFQITSSSSLQTLEKIIFEVSIPDGTMQTILNTLPTPPLTCYEYDANPIILFNLSDDLLIPCDKGYDYNQFSRANGKYSVIVPAKYGTYSKILIGIYVQLVGGQPFNVRVRGQFSTYTHDICPFDCNMGESTTSNCKSGVCICPTGLIDYDCSQSAQLIDSSSTTINIMPNQMHYAYYLSKNKVKSQSDAATIIVQIDMPKLIPEIKLYFTVQGQSQKKVVPTSEIYQQSYTLRTQISTLTLDSTDLYDSSLNPLYSVFGFTIESSPSSSSLEISIRGDDTDDTNMSIIIIFVLVGVVALLFTIWIVLTIVRIKYARRNRVVNMTLMTQQMIAQAQQQQNQQNVRIRPNAPSKLTLEIINKFMPAVPFSVIEKREKDKGKTFIESCPVCLGDFESTEICRQVICGHYFHKDCIESWLKKQENCPFCRAELTTEALRGEVVNNNLEVNNRNAEQASSSHHLQQSGLLIQPAQVQQNMPALQQHHVGRLSRNNLHIIPAPGLSQYNNANLNNRTELSEQAPQSQAPLMPSQQNGIASRNQVRRANNSQNVREINSAGINSNIQSQVQVQVQVQDLDQ